MNTYIYKPKITKNNTMTIKLNATQEELIITAKDKGFLIKDDFKLHYTSPITIKANIERFILLNIIEKPDGMGRYSYKGEQDE